VNMNQTVQVDIPCVSNDGRGVSYFTVHSISLSGDEQRKLSEQQACENFRLRSSDAGYASGFHVAGDPTLLIILAGTLKISLRNGENQCFSAGEMFVAEDYLDEGVEFNDSLHGHSAQLQGDQALMALHLKLNKR